MKSLANVILRPWTVDDLYFTLKVRNHPLLMNCFRQDEPITVEEQKAFIEKDVIDGAYNGMIIEADGEKVGMCGVKETYEFTIAVLPEYQHKGISTTVMHRLIDEYEDIWSEVFVGNPALEWFISVLGFKIVSVRERAYFKRDIGLIDVVRIER